MSNFTRGWYVLYTRAKQENKIALQLSERAIQFYLPKIKVVRQWHDRKKTVDMPLFPNYLFVQPKSASEFFTCKDLKGGCGYVNFGKQPSVISQRIIDSVQMLIDSGQNVDVSSESFQQGQILKIKSGSLAGQDCEVVHVKGKLKIIVRVILLNRNLIIDIPQEYLSPLYDFDIHHSAYNKKDVLVGVAR